MLTIEQRQIIDKYYQKEFLTIYRKTLNKISKLNLINLEIELNIKFEKTDRTIKIIVFDENNNNIFFTFYDFHELEDIKSTLKNLMFILKKDDFSEIKAFQRSLQNTSN